MCAFVKLFYMCSNGLVFVCGLEHAFVSTQNYTQIVTILSLISHHSHLLIPVHLGWASRKA